MPTNDRLEPTVFIIFGGAGDLTWRKLVPALFDLSLDRSMPADFSIIAVDRAELNDEADEIRNKKVDVLRARAIRTGLGRQQKNPRLPRRRRRVT
jgi:glucose-6-phosphate 1-dehydrogenase